MFCSFYSFSRLNHKIWLRELKTLNSLNKFKTFYQKVYNRKKAYKLLFLKTTQIKRIGLIVRKSLFPLSGMKGIALLKRIDKV